MAAKQVSDAAAALWIRHADEVYGYVLANCRNIADADDVFQIVGLAVVQADDVPDETRHFLAWVRKLAYHRILKFYRSAGRCVPIAPELAERLAEADTRVSDDEDFSDRRDALLHCLDRLPADKRDMLAAYYGDERAALEGFAKQRGRTTQGIYSLVYRVRKLLKDCVERRLRVEESS